MRLRILASLAIAGTLLAACSDDSPDQPAEGQASDEPTEINFTFDWTCEGTWIPMVLAETNGWFDEAGLSVSHAPGQGSSAVVPLLAAQEYDLSILNTAAVLPAVAQDIPVSIVGLDSAISPFYLIGQEGISAPEDLYGLTVGVQTGQIEGAAWQAFVDATGIDESKVTVQPIKPGQEVLFVDGKLDAMLYYYPSPGVAEMLETRPGEESLLPIQEWVPMYGDAVVASNKFVEESPEGLEKFLEVWARAEQYAIENQQEAADLLAESCPDLNQTAVDFQVEVFTEGWSAEPHASDGLLTFDPSGFDESARVLIEGELMDDVDISEAYTDQFLPDPPIMPSGG